MVIVIPGVNIPLTFNMQICVAEFFFIFFDRFVHCHVLKKNLEIPLTDKKLCELVFSQSLFLSDWQQQPCFKSTRESERERERNETES